jgi:hypothetical protein
VEKLELPSILSPQKEATSETVSTLEIMCRKCGFILGLVIESILFVPMKWFIYYFVVELKVTNNTTLKKPRRWPDN